MLTIRRRGKTFHADMLIGDIRIRGSLGTRNQDAARRLTHRLETALSEGATSSLWPELKTLLPRLTYGRFADYVGVKDQQVPTWNDLREAFTTHMEQRRNIGKLQGSTEERYKVTLREFESFLAAQKITRLQDIAKPLVESFKVWRVERIKKKRYARGATGLVLDAAILHRVFAFAVESEMIVKNPVRMEGRPGENPEHGAEPFTAEDLSRLRGDAGDDQLAFLLLRWTGLRGSDAVSLTWREVHFDRKEIERGHPEAKEASNPADTHRVAVWIGSGMEKQNGKQNGKAEWKSRMEKQNAQSVRPRFAESFNVQTAHTSPSVSSNACSRKAA